MTERGTGPRKYQLLADLGHGGMADVFLAVLRGPTDFKKLSVIKRLRSHLAEDAEFLAMFLQEARIAARLNHPNVVNTFEVGHDGRHHFMAMEYLQGQSLSALITRVGREKLDLALQIKLLIDALEGLHYAHELQDFDGTPLGLVHRDVSPQNIFITYDGQVKLLDFGIAKALDSSVETRTGVIKGKLSYMPPEQALGGSLDRRADLYSVGVILWEAVAGRRRWRTKTNAEVMKELVNTKEPELPAMPNLPPLLGATLRKVLAFDPEARHRDALELQADLEGVLERMGRPVSKRQIGQLMKEQFAEDRARLEEVIERQLAKASDVDDRPMSSSDAIRLELPSSSRTPSFRLEPVDAVPSSRTPSGIVEQLAVDQSQTLSVSQLVELKEQPKPRPRRRNLLPIAAALLVGAVALGLFFFRRYRNETDATVGTIQAPPAMVQLRLAATPEDATLFLNGQRLATNPYTGALPKSGEPAFVRAEKDGYLPQMRTVRLDSDVYVELVLRKSTPPAAPPAASSSEPPSKQKRERGGSVTQKLASPSTLPSQAPSAAPRAPEPNPPSGVKLDTESPWSK